VIHAAHTRNGVPEHPLGDVVGNDRQQFQSWHRDDEILATPPFTVNEYISHAIRQAVADGVNLRVG
jgi:hypothetical protein